MQGLRGGLKNKYIYIYDMKIFTFRFISVKCDYIKIKISL